jgi:hypothetical protein|tara:strand:- start:264 stop:899 length:636 start_codon:yes stop_codon:yes gene_type:complete
MKKTILFLLALIFTSSIYSQIKIGLNAGATYSKPYEGYMGFDAGIDFLIGASFEYYLNENLLLKTNLNYERKSFGDSFPFTDNRGMLIGQIKATTNFDYLTIPIMAKYEFGNSKKFFVNGGPFLGFLLREENKADVPSVGQITTIDLINKKIDVGLSFGIGTKIYINDKSDLNIELRENLGLLNISDNEVYEGGNLKTNSLNLILNWSFGI